MYVLNASNLSELDMANHNINLISDDNDNNEIEEMTIDETKFSFLKQKACKTKTIAFCTA